ncbi:MAG: hypothetical protein WD554_02450 [Flavobacteriaceae bacterium]
MKKTKVILLIIIALIIFGGIFYWIFRIDIEDYFISQDAIYWSEDVAISLADYEDEITPNSDLDVNFYHAFYLKANSIEKAYVRSYFDKSKSWAKDTTKYDFSKQNEIQKIRFDLYEVYARKFNEKINEIKYEKSTRYEDLTKIGDSLFNEINISLDEIDNPNVEPEKIVQKWKPIVDKMLNNNEK